MNGKVKYVLGSRSSQAVLYHLLRGYLWTLRLKIENEAEWLARVQKGEPVLLCAWHQQFFSAVRYFKKFAPYHPALMISQSRDGAIIAGIARKSGWNPVRGSSSRGGRQALEQVVRHLKATRLAGHIMDGPRGPAGHVKPGAIRIALEAGALIVPFYVMAPSAWVFNSWDRFFIPRPFSRVILRYDHPIRLTPPGSEADFESLRKHVEAAMRPGLR